MNKLQKPLCGFDKDIGVELISYGDGKCSISLDIQERHLNIGKSLHGGVINALLDIVISAAVTSLFHEKSERVVTLQMGTNFLRPAREGETVRAHGEVLKQGSTIVYAEGWIENTEGKMLAKASGDWFVQKIRGKFRALLQIWARAVKLSTTYKLCQRQ